MYSFVELINNCIDFTLKSLSDVNEKTIEALQTRGASHLVRSLEMIQFQKAILAIGVFSIFEASLQDGLRCTNGFDTAKEILDNEGEYNIKDRFDNYILAINVLKHGRGRSYDTLVAKVQSLPFKVRMPCDSFFQEGNVSEISTLVQVDDTFVRNCNSIICAVSEVIQRTHPEFY